MTYSTDPLSHPPEFWDIVRQVSGGEECVLDLLTRTNARSVKTRFYAFRRGLLRHNDPLWQQARHVSCQANGAQVRFFSNPRTENERRLRAQMEKTDGNEI